MSLSTPENVHELKVASHDKAKELPDFRFYALYDKVYRKGVLRTAPQTGRIADTMVTAISCQRSDSDTFL
jgi:hypothetical protein